MAQRKEAAARKTRSEKIVAAAGKGFLALFLRGASLIKCLLELIKNAEDWEASQINIVTDRKAGTITILDNGIGMGQENRKAFVSINLSTAKGKEGKAGTFGTGRAYAVFLGRLDTRTISAEDPGQVYQFSLNRDDMEDHITRGADNPVECAIVPKSKDAWPYPEFKTGTAITIALYEPDARGMLWDEKLAARLAQVLPMRYQGIIKVNGKPLPSKAIIGQIYAVNINHPQLGVIELELYRPKNAAEGEGLFMSPSRVGEIPFANFLTHLQGLGLTIPTIFLHPEVCGIIRAAYLADYANEDRITLNPSIADDPRTMTLISLLQKFSPDIETRLQIQSRQSQGSAQRDMEALAEICRKKFGLPRTVLPGPEEELHADEFDFGEQDTGTVDPVTPTLRLTMNRKEFALGEVAEIRAIIPKQASYSGNDIQWSISDCGGQVLAMDDGVLRIKCTQVGNYSIQASAKDSLQTATTGYSIVQKRLFRLNMAVARVTVGNDLIIMAVNADTLTEGKVQWKLEGGGELKPEGNRALYSATQIRPARVTAFDPMNLVVQATCSISVVPLDGVAPIIRIGDNDYELRPLATTGRQNESPIKAIRGGTNVHTLLIDEKGRGYQEHLKTNGLKDFLINLVCLHVAGFELIDLDTENSHQQLKAKTLRDLINNRAAELLTIFHT